MKPSTSKALVDTTVRMCTYAFPALIVETRCVMIFSDWSVAASQVSGAQRPSKVEMIRPPKNFLLEGCRNIALLVREGWGPLCHLGGD